LDHRIGILDLGTATDTDPFKLSERHGKRTAITKPDDLATDSFAATALQMNAIADR
jgi:hypothetical protein